jgi:hypothetical protein
MNPIVQGIVLGVIAGAISVGIMWKMKFPDRRGALLGAFANRFLIGLFTATSILPLHPILAGGLIGLLVSIPPAIVTKSYAPILGIGVVLGLACGAAVMYWPA